MEINLKITDEENGKRKGKTGKKLEKQHLLSSSGKGKELFV
jgi:hypothetical protein